MKQRKIPMRMCSVTRERFEKKDLLRIVKTPEGEFKVDLTGKLNGRGVSVKKDKEVFEKAKVRKVFDKTFEMEVDPSIYDELLNLEI